MGGNKQGKKAEKRTRWIEKETGMGKLCIMLARESHMREREKVEERLPQRAC